MSLHRIDILTCSAITVKYRRTETLSNSIPSRAGSAVVGADIQVRPPMFLGSPSCALQHVRFPCVNNLTGSTQPVKCFSRYLLSSIIEYNYSSLDFSENGSEQSRFSPCFYIFIITRYVFMSMNFLFGQCVSHFAPLFPTLVHTRY